MKPTIGRIVHFEDGAYGTCAALITNVDDESSVTLALFRKYPPIEDQEPVVYVKAEYSDTPEIGHWSWPPRI